MMYRPSDAPPIPCGWTGCRDSASSIIYNSDLTDSLWLCRFHKRVAAVNLEQYDKLRVPGAVKSAEAAKRPTHGIQPPPAGTSSKRPVDQHVDAEEWEKEAARKADAAAAPIGPQEVDEGEEGRDPDIRTIIKPIITDLPTRRRGE